jgi:hypothetical protein
MPLRCVSFALVQWAMPHVGGCNNPALQRIQHQCLECRCGLHPGLSTGLKSDIFVCTKVAGWLNKRIPMCPLQIEGPVQRFLRFAHRPEICRWPGLRVELPLSVPAGRMLNHRKWLRAGPLHWPFGQAAGQLEGPGCQLLQPGPARPERQVRSGLLLGRSLGPCQWEPSEK